MTYTEPVRVAGGAVRGSLEKGIRVFRGIPYAAPPVGELRWKAPAPPVPWEGVLDCVRWAKSPVQGPQGPFWMWTKEFIIEDTGYSEDCLYLNVWTGAEAPERRPVIVFFHGGNLISGGPSCEIYSGQSLAEKGAVYVSVGFRVGIPGLLATTDLAAENETGVSGNWLILDQLASLRWIRDNIAAFGGDPDNVTITGLSAGANNVNSLCVIPQAKGLFRRAFAMSFMNYGYMEDTRGWKTLAELTAIGDAYTAGRSLKEMREIPAETFPTAPVLCNIAIDGQLLSRSFTESVNAGDSDGIPCIQGMVAEDGLLCRLIPIGAPVDAEKTVEAVRSWFGEDAEQALSLYPVDPEHPETALDAMGHDAFLTSMLMFAAERSRHGAQPTWLYEFTHVTPGVGSDVYGAFHSSDMPYFWNIFSDERKDDWTEKDFALGDRLSSALIRFAEGENPDPSGAWQPSDGEARCLIGAEECRMAPMDPRKRELWERKIREKMSGRKS